MTLPTSPPQYPSWTALVASIKEGERGWRGYALQTALNTSGAHLTADGVVGPLTVAAVVAFQRNNFLDADGIAGGATQGKLLERIGTGVSQSIPALPDGLMRGFAEGEGANVLAATNWTVVAGVDCGCMQLRVLGAPFSMERLRVAFDAHAAMLEAGLAVAEKASLFYAASWVAKQPNRSEWAMRCAVLNHNWQYGAAQIARYGKLPNPDRIATWVPAELQPMTWGGWATYYVKQISKYVKDWTPDA